MDLSSRQCRYLLALAEDLHLRLTEGSSVHLVDELHANRLDLAIVREPDAADLVIHELVRERFILAVPRSIHLPSTVRLRRIADQPFIMVPRAANPRIYAQL